jgi:hypothetical protein
MQKRPATALVAGRYIFTESKLMIERSICDECGESKDCLCIGYNDLDMKNLVCFICIKKEFLSHWGKPTERTLKDGEGYLQCPNCDYADVPSEFSSYYRAWDLVDDLFGGDIQCKQCEWVDSEVNFISAYINRD